MSLKTKLVSIITLAMGVVVFSTGAFAQDDKTTTTTVTPNKVERRHKGDGEHGMRKEGREGMRGHHGDKGLMKGLNLTDAQKAQIKSIREANKPDKAKFEQLKAIREAHKNGTAITDEQKQQLKAFREQAQTKAKSVHEQILNVLTADQKSQLEQHRQQMEQKREEFRKNRPAKPAATDKPKTI